LTNTVAILAKDTLTKDYSTFSFRSFLMELLVQDSRRFVDGFYPEGFDKIRRFLFLISLIGKPKEYIRANRPNVCSLLSRVQKLPLLDLIGDFLEGTYKLGFATNEESVVAHIYDTFRRGSSSNDNGSNDPEFPGNPPRTTDLLFDEVVKSHAWLDRLVYCIQTIYQREQDLIRQCSRSQFLTKLDQKWMHQFGRFVAISKALFQQTDAYAWELSCVDQDQLRTEHQIQYFEQLRLMNTTSDDVVRELAKSRASNRKDVKFTGRNRKVPNHVSRQVFGPASASVKKRWYGNKKRSHSLSVTD
jgi:hypothetical protein